MPTDSDDSGGSMDSSFRFNMTAETKSRLEAMADRLGQSQGEVVRSLIDDQQLPDRRADVPEEAKELNRHLAMAGNNLNQIARWANRHKSEAETADILTALVVLENQVEDIRETFDKILTEVNSGDSDDGNQAE